MIWAKVRLSNHQKKCRLRVWKIQTVAQQLIMSLAQKVPNILEMFPFIRNKKNINMDLKVQFVELLLNTFLVSLISNTNLQICSQTPFALCIKNN
jgi:hypothetical protein